MISGACDFGFLGSTHPQHYFFLFDAQWNPIVIIESLTNPKNLGCDLIRDDAHMVIRDRVRLARGSLCC